MLLLGQRPNTSLATSQRSNEPELECISDALLPFAAQELNQALQQRAAA